MHEDKLVTTAAEAGRKLLRRQSRPLNLNNPSDVRLMCETADILIGFCKSNPCYGLSASMFGVPVQMICLNKQNAPQILVNPKILKMTGRTEWIESCYSFVGSCSIVERPYETEVEYFDLAGKKNTETFTGLWSTVFGHEYIHFFGVCAQDITTKPLLSPDEIGVYRKNNPQPIILSETGRFEYPPLFDKPGKI